MLQRSYWEETMPVLAADIAIIGAGFLGLWSAFLAKQKFPQAHIIVVDQEVLQTRASTRNAGFACFGSPSEIWSDVQLNGESKAFGLVQMRWEGLQFIQQHFPAKALQWENEGGYECFEKEFSVDIIEKINKNLTPVLGTPHCFTAQHQRVTALGLQGFQQLYYNSLESQLHSGAYWQAMYLRCVQMGVHIIQGVAIHQIEKQAQGFALYHQQKKVVEASTVLLATNALSNDLWPTTEPIQPQRGSVLVTEPIPHLPLKGCFHYEEGFYYFRNVGDRILLGGARNTSFDTENTSDTQVNSSIKTALDDFLQKHFAGHGGVQISHQWSGTMGFTTGKMPLLHQPESGLYQACGCNGMGVALTPILAKQWVNIL